jgi:GNAT superfamily N-acetyltransferase
MIRIRERGVQDVPGCVRALRTVHERDGYPAIWPPDPGRWVTSSDMDTSAWVAVDSDGSVFGHVAVQHGAPNVALSALTSHPAERLLSVVRLFVDPAARGRAVGAALMTVAADYAHSRALLPALEVADSGTAARRLYDQLGWICLGTQQASWTDTDGRHPLLYLYVHPACDLPEVPSSGHTRCE